MERSTNNTTNKREAAEAAVQVRADLAALAR
jgi:hypothetical protein